jgi:hypothetical protein
MTISSNTVRRAVRRNGQPRQGHIPAEGSVAAGSGVRRRSCRNRSTSRSDFATPAGGFASGRSVSATPFPAQCRRPGVRSCRRCARRDHSPTSAVRSASHRTHHRQGSTPSPQLPPQLTGHPEVLNEPRKRPEKVRAQLRAAAPYVTARDSSHRQLEPVRDRRDVTASATRRWRHGRTGRLR